jgi:phytoene synthase
MFNKNSQAYAIFKKASTTFFFFSLFFPPEKRKDIFDLYAFMRIPDEYIDQKDPDIRNFNTYKAEYNKHYSSNEFINKFILLEKKYNLDKNWAQSLFSSFEMDIEKQSYQTFKELESYLYGISEVVGLFMAAILELPKESYKYARLQGKAMQMINIIRDINIDKTELNRVYIPQEYLNKFSIKDLDKKTIELNSNSFKLLIEFLIKQYLEVQKQATIGYKYIPKRCLIPIKSAADAYLLTAEKIRKNPMLIFETKVKPTRWEFYKILINNLFYKP